MDLVIVLDKGNVIEPSCNTWLQCCKEWIVTAVFFFLFFFTIIRNSGYFPRHYVLQVISANSANAWSEAQGETGGELCVKKKNQRYRNVDTSFRSSSLGRAAYDGGWNTLITSRDKSREKFLLRHLPWQHPSNELEWQHGMYGRCTRAVRLRK